MIVSNKVFWCGTFHQKTRTSSMAVTANKPYRETLLLNDRKNNGPGGLSYPKRIKTVRLQRMHLQIPVYSEMGYGLWVLCGV
jgi:hypothetical protein